MYQVKIYRLPDRNEYEYHYRGNYGARGEPRAKRAKVTSEYQAALNQKHKEKYMRRKILMNFKAGDLWVTLKYPKGTRKSVKEVQKDRAAFLRTLRGLYRKSGNTLKFIYRLEIGKLGGIHLHMIINNCAGATDWIRESWPGHVNMEFMYEDGGFEALADYITKPAESDTGQMYFEGMNMEDKKAFMTYGCSRNLKKPVPEIRTYSHWTMRAVLDANDDPTPAAGYYIDKASVRRGINPYTGYSYLYYTEKLLKEFKKGGGYG